MSTVVYRAKLWSDDEERIDYADLEETGQPIVVFATGAIGTGQLKPGEVAKKVGWLGGPGIIGQFILPVNFVMPLRVRYTVSIGQVTVPGAMVGDVVILNDMLLPDGTRPPRTTPPSPLDSIIFFGVATLNTVTIYAYAQAPAIFFVLPVFSRFNFRVFGF